MFKKPTTISTDLLGPNAIKPPAVVTPEYVKGFRAATISSLFSGSIDTTPDQTSAIHVAIRQVTKTLERSASADKTLFFLLRNKLSEQPSQLQLITLLHETLWQVPTAALIQLLSLVVDVPEKVITPDSYFTYVEAFTQRWRDVLCVARIQEAYPRGFFSQNPAVDEMTSIQQVYAHLRLHPAGDTRKVVDKVTEVFKQEDAARFVVRENAKAQTATAFSNQMPSSSSQSPFSAAHVFHQASAPLQPFSSSSSAPHASITARPILQAEFLDFLLAAMLEPGNEANVKLQAELTVAALGSLGKIPHDLLETAERYLPADIYTYLVHHSLSSTVTSVQASAPTLSQISQSTMPSSSAIPFPSSSSTSQLVSSSTSPVEREQNLTLLPHFVTRPVSAFAQQKPATPQPIQSSPVSSSTSSGDLVIIPGEENMLVHNNELLVDTSVSGQWLDKPVRAPIHVVFIVDVSGSMSTAINDVKATLKTMVNERLRTGDKVSIIKFDTTASVVVNARTLPDRMISSTIDGQIREGSTTNMIGGFQALSMLNKTMLETHVVLATDGQDDRGYRLWQGKDYTTRQAYIEAMLTLAVRHLGSAIPVHTIGMTVNVDQQLTGPLSQRTSGTQQFIRDQRDIGQAVDGLANYLCADDRVPVGTIRVTQNGNTLAEVTVPSLPAGSNFPQFFRFSHTKVNTGLPLTISYHFPPAAPVVHQVSYDPRAICNIDVLAADMTDRYERLIAGKQATLRDQLVALLTEIVMIKTTYHNASWVKLNEAENTVRKYLDALESGNTAQQMQLQAADKTTRSLLPSFLSASTFSSAADDDGNAAPIRIAEQASLPALNVNNVSLHLAHATDKNYGALVAALRTFAGTANLNDNMLTAMTQGNTAEVQRLLNNGVSPLEVNTRGWSWIMVAIHAGADQAMIQTLVEQGVPLDIRTSGRQATALTMAQSHLQAVRTSSVAPKLKQELVDRLEGIVRYLTHVSLNPAPSTSLQTSQSLFPPAGLVASVPESSSSVQVVPSPALPMAAQKEFENGLDPFTMELMVNPVILSSGISCDKASIDAEIARQRNIPSNTTGEVRCPLTRVILQPMPGGHLYMENTTLKNLLEEMAKNTIAATPAITAAVTP